MSFPHHRWPRPGEVWGAASGQGTDEALAIQTSVPGPLSRDVRGEGFTPREARGGPPHNHRHGWPAAIQTVRLLQHRPGAAVTQAGSRSSRAGARCRRSPVYRPWLRR